MVSNLNRAVRCLTLATAMLITQPSRCQDGRFDEVGPSVTVHVDRGDQGMVVSDSAPASRIGRDILAQGGTAVDAAVATALALAVAWPDAGNIGGGGFMLIRPADGRHPICVDYRETAPSSMHARSFTRQDTTLSHKAVGVPGTIRGLAAAHSQYGKLPWRELVMPAAQLAADGVPIDEPLAESLNSVLMDSMVMQDARFAELRRVYGRPDREPWQVGDRLVLPDLARTLTLIAEQGPDAFYRGEIARSLVAEMQRGNGLISMSDLENYQAKIRDVIRGQYRGYTILGAPPPSSGGICVVESLNILEHFDLGNRHRYDPITIHLIAEAARRAFADRARFLGDPDFVRIPEKLTDKAYAKELAATISMARATPSASITPEIEVAGESPDTTHFSIVDGEGMAVSNTYTLEASWGSRIVVKDAGFVLNNEMGDFNWFPGETNVEGRIGTPANTVAGGKRMLSSQSPVIVEKQGRLVLVTGSPGGRTIINTVLCILLNVIDFRQSPAEAVAGARMHHQWFPDQIELERIEEPPHDGAVDSLEAMGHVVGGREVQGSAHTIAIDPDTNQRTGVADHRRGGRPAAINSSTLALWDFAEPAATSLPETRNFRGSQRRWSRSLPDCETDGRDHFRIRARRSAITSSAGIDLPTAAAAWSAEIKIDSARFSGDQMDEELRFSFVQTADSNREIATLTFGRHGTDDIVLQGHADGESIGPITLSDHSELNRPVILNLALDPTRQILQIGSRDASAEAFTIHGTAPVGQVGNIDRFQMGTRNDIFSDGEFINVDRIEVRSSTLADPLGQ